MTAARRTFLQYCAAVASARVVLPRWSLGWRNLRQAPTQRTPWAAVRWHAGDPPDLMGMQALGQRAVEAAMAAGAAYADVRLTQTLTEHYTSNGRGCQFADGCIATVASDFPTPGYNVDGWATSFGGGGGPGKGLTLPPSHVPGIPTLVLGIGVRAFVRGYWGFAASPYWTADESARLGHEAAGQATRNAQAGAPRAAELGKVPVVHNGRWIQPGIDPFTVPSNEKLDWLRTVLELAAQYDRFAATSGTNDLDLWREARVFASSEGASYAQVRYRCVPPSLIVTVQLDNEGGLPGLGGDAEWTPDPLQARGWESLRDLDLNTLIPRLLNQARYQRDTPEPRRKPVEIGKYDVVFGAEAAAELVYATLGVATELDRALGYEANASGTSYLGPDPLRYLGTPVAAPSVTLTANRTTPHALATAQWDDEGIPCQEFPLIADGILTDYQTTREQAAWLAPWYAKRGMTVQSRGCAIAETALDYPIQQSPNFVLAPGKSAATVEHLIADTARGVYYPTGWLTMDQQVRNGVVHPREYAPPREIRNGKLGAVLQGAGVLFSASELWKNVLALGGAESAGTTITGEAKGQPSQRSLCNVTAVPMKVSACACIDLTRKA